MNQTQIQRDAQGVFNLANDYARDYRMHLMDVIWDATKEYRNHFGWSDDYAIQVCTAAKGLAK